MTLTTAQFNALKIAITADPVAGPMKQAQDTVSLLAWCNAQKPATPAWRTSVGAEDSDEAATYTSYDTLTQGKRDSWNIFLKFTRNYSKVKIRNWINDVWAGVGTVSVDVLTAGTENATNAQAIIGGSVTATAGVSALRRNFSDLVTQAEVNLLVN